MPRAATDPPADDARIRVLLVDDQPLVRRGLRTLLDLEDDLHVVAEAGDGIEALEVVRRTAIDVALVDAQMPEMDGVELIERVTEQHPGVACLVLTTFADEEIFARGLRAGARGHLVKDVEPDELVASVRLAHRGRAVLGRTAVDLLVARYLATSAPTTAPGDDLDVLSAQERVVARQVAKGATNREIARSMFLTEGTVKNHVSAILRKLELRDRTALAIRLAADPARREP